MFLVVTNGLEPSTSRLSGVRSNHLSYAPNMYGGDEENRTPDPLLAKQVLSQLSYTPIIIWDLLSCILKIEQCYVELNPLTSEIEIPFFHGIL